MMQICIKGSCEAVKLYQKAFNAKLISEYKNEDGSYIHAELDLLIQGVMKRIT
jgi:PhnB protein